MNELSMCEKASGWHRIINDNAFAGKGLSLALRVPSFLPDRFRRVFSIGFIRFWASRAPPGRV